MKTPCCNTMPHSATHNYTLQRTTAHCNTLQHRPALFMWLLAMQSGNSSMDATTPDARRRHIHEKQHMHISIYIQNIRLFISLYIHTEYINIYIYIYICVYIYIYIYVYRLRFHRIRLRAPPSNNLMQRQFRGNGAVSSHF